MPGARDDAVGDRRDTTSRGRGSRCYSWVPQGARRFFGFAAFTAISVLVLAVSLSFFASWLRSLASERTVGPREGANAKSLTSALIMKGGEAGKAWADTVLTGYALVKAAKLGCAKIEDHCWAGICSSVDYLHGAGCAMDWKSGNCFRSVFEKDEYIVGGIVNEYAISTEMVVEEISANAIPGDSGSSCLVSLDNATAYTVANPKPRGPPRTLEVALNIWAAEWFINEACAPVGEVAWGNATTSLSGLVRAYLLTYGLYEVSLWGGAFHVIGSEIAYNEETDVVTINSYTVGCQHAALGGGPDVDTGFDGSVKAVAALYSAAVWLLGPEEVGEALGLRSRCSEANYEASEIEISAYGHCGLSWTVNVSIAAYAMMGGMVLWGMLRAFVVLRWMSREAPCLLAVLDEPVAAAGPQLSIEVPPFTVLSVPKAKWKAARGGTLIETAVGDGVEAYCRRPPRVWSMFMRTGRLPTVMVDLDWRKKSHLEASSLIGGRKLAVVGWGSTGRVSVEAPPIHTGEAAAEMTAGGGNGVFPVLLALLSPFLIPATPIINEAPVSVALFAAAWKLLAGGLTSEAGWARAAASPGVQLVCSAAFGVVTDKVGAGLVFHATSAVLWWAGSLRWAATASSANDMGTSLWLRASSDSTVGASQDYAGFWLRPPLSGMGTVEGFGCGGARRYGLSLSITAATRVGLDEGVVVGHAPAWGEVGREKKSAKATHVVTG